MADLKISQLTGASTPLAGTEVLPIVQSGSTVKVSVANLTAGRAVGMAGGSFTDNITQSTAAKGINFTANTPAAGMTSQLLNWYEEGAFTPTISGSSSAGAGTYSVQQGRYTRVGNIVYVTAVMTWSAHTGTGNMRLTGLPFTSLNVASLDTPLSIQVNQIALTANNVAQVTVKANTTYAEVLQYPVGGGAVADVPIDTAGTIRYAGAYFTA